MSMNVVDGKRKKKNAFSLEGLKEAREGTVSRLDQYEDEDVDDVYDLVDEDKYASIVESRRKMDDFVVDDNGLGYHDDGEEHLGIGEDTMDAKKRLKDAQRDGDNRLSKKARRLADSSGPKGSIMRHMQAGMPTGGQRTQAEKKASVQTEMDIDSLLAAKPTPAPSTFRRPQPRKYQTGQTGHAPRAQEQEQEEEQEQYVDDEGFEMQEEVTKVEGEGGVEPFSATGVEEAPAPAPVKLSLSKGTRKLKASEPMQAALGGQAQGAGAVWGYKPDLDADVSTLAVMAQIDSMAGAGAAAASGSGFGKIDPRSWLQYKAAVTTEAGAEAGVEGEAEGEGEKGEEYVNMFWLDAAENNGVLYLFGKIAVNDLQPPPGAPAQAPAQAQAQTQKRYVSCCVVVHGSERNLFVLPRSAPDTFKEDGSAARLGMADVYKELSSMLVPSVVPRSQGQAFRCKAVRRRYAFEHGDIPREEAEYLKVVYSATHGVPNPTQCAGGRTYERIFGAGASALELFLLKRKLMGPCWITIRKPKMNPSQVSWCRVEIAIGNPKDIERTSNGGPSPPLTSLSVSIKTAVNPTTHMHEVIMLSGVVHHRIEQDADSDTHPRHQKRFTFIRQLGVSCGPTYPATFPHDLAKAALEAKFTSCSNERALLSAFFARMQAEDPDVLCSHNLLGFEADVILARALVNKLPNWSILGRLRKSRAPRSINDKDIAAGRILCDTYKAAKEFLRETTYSLTHLAASQLKVSRVEVDPMDVPKFFSSTKDIMKLAMANMHDAMLVQGLMMKLQVVPLTKQLTNLSGNLWSRTIRGARAERIEYLLLHEFHQMKFVLPEKKAFEGKKGGDEDDDGPKVGGMSRKRGKAAYAGGLVLEPKKGLYDTYILLLDFNSLYPSIIQEYNLCFTTINWTKHMGEIADKVKEKSKEGGGESGDESEEDAGAGSKGLAPLPDSGSAPGILPRVIKTLVDRRRVVKDLLKKERDPVQKQQLDIRQKALKLTANSMYGCLGFTFSRFYARPIAALVTAMGREALQRTVDLATTQLSLDVIYGDTDSVMINTNMTDLAAVKEIGNMVKKEVNKLYRSLELDLDGIFKSMLLLKKKKYAAVVIHENSDGTLTYEKEMKGLDLVRRDWCGVSKQAGQFVVEQILSGKPREEIVMAIHEYLEDLAVKIRSGQVPLEGFVVTKGLNKNPKDYPDCKGQAHLQVALQMLKNNRPVNIGDHIPYVICLQGPAGAQPAQRARHPDDLIRANAAMAKIKSEGVKEEEGAEGGDKEKVEEGVLTLDYEWYLSTQILPPIARLCEPIEGTSPAILSERMGLDASKYIRAAQSDELLEEGWGFTPKCQMDDAERFAACLPLTSTCLVCRTECQVKSVQLLTENTSCLSCDKCGSQYFGRLNAGDCYCYLSNRVTLLVRACVKRYYDCWLVCDDPSCGRRTMQQSVRGFNCTENCHGRMVQEYDEAALHTQLKCLESLFDVHRLQTKKKLSDVTLRQLLPLEQVELMHILKQHMSNSVEGSAYNWIRPSLWSTLFARTTGAREGKEGARDRDGQLSIGMGVSAM